MAAINMTRAGYESAHATRVIPIVPSSNGWRRPSRTLRRYSGISSRKRMPLWAREISPGRGMVPPPISPASEMEWCGDRKGRVQSSGSPEGNRPETL